MERKMLAQEYLALMYDEKGSLPSIYLEEVKGAVIAAVLMDMMAENVVKLEGKKIVVTAPLPEKLAPAASLYEYLKEKPHSTYQTAAEYLISTGRKMQELINSLADDLVAEEKVKKVKGKYREVYITGITYRNSLAGALRESVLEGESSAHDMALAFLLMETKALSRYFFPEERDVLEKTLKEMHKDPKNKPYLEIICFMDNLMIVFVFLIIFIVVLW